MIKAGESVTVSLAAANRDPLRFGAGADELDVDRASQGHLAFGHGIHQCLGRFPGLRLAVAAEDVPMRPEMAIYGVHRLPVTW